MGFFGHHVTIDNLSGTGVIEYLISNSGIKDFNNAVVVSPDAGGVVRAKLIQQGFVSLGYDKIGFAMIVKQRPEAGKIDSMDLIGSVDKKDVIIIDDMIDSAGTLCKAADSLKTFGAQKVFAYATHGLFNDPACENIEKSNIDQIIVTNSIPLSDKVKERLVTKGKIS